MRPDTYVVLTIFRRLSTGSLKWHSFLRRAHLSLCKLILVSLSRILLAYLSQTFAERLTHLAFAFEQVVHDLAADLASIAAAEASLTSIKMLIFAIVERRDVKEKSIEPFNVQDCGGLGLVNSNGVISRFLPPLPFLRWAI